MDLSRKVEYAAQMVRNIAEHHDAPGKDIEDALDDIERAISAERKAARKRRPTLGVLFLRMR